MAKDIRCKGEAKESIGVSDAADKATEVEFMATNKVQKPVIMVTAGGNSKRYGRRRECCALLADKIGTEY